VPIPSPRSGEQEQSFITRCMSDDVMQREYTDSTQRAAVCYAAWKKEAESMTTKAVTKHVSSAQFKLLRAVRSRKGGSPEPFDYGIMTADRFVRNVLDCVGSDLCYRQMATRSTSLHDLLEKSARSLTYSNQEMVLEDIYSKAKKEEALRGVELPKNTLMLFKHTLTSTRKDRDGDILRTKGAKPDPKMLLLWQHVHTLPIGKQLAVADHTDTHLKMFSAVVDINPLAHDSAVMIDNKMGRFSHGFKALEFEEIKTSKGKVTGFDVTSFEIMEASLVSVPSNVDAETEDILLSLVEGRKLTSPLMKAYGKAIREKQPVRVPVTIDLNIQLNGESDGSGKKECSCASEEAHDDPQQDQEWGQEGKATDNEEVKKKEPPMDSDEEEADEQEGACPECGGEMEDGVCEECGYTEEDKEEEKAAKVGRTISADNESKIREAKDNMDEVIGMEDVSRACKALCKVASNKLQEVLDAVASTAMEAGANPQEKQMGATEAMAVFLASCTQEERKKMKEFLDSFDQVDEGYRRVEMFENLMGG